MPSPQEKAWKLDSRSSFSFEAPSYSSILKDEIQFIILTSSHKTRPYIFTYHSLHSQHTSVPQAYSE